MKHKAVAMKEVSYC